MLFYGLFRLASIGSIQLALIQSFDMPVAVPYYKEFFFSFLPLSKPIFSNDITYLLEEITLKSGVNLECNNS